jgi:hypothetical protein
VGIGLTIDEFALWVYLDDVYWSKEGRSSIDAALIAFAVIGLMILGVRPFEIDRDSSADLIATIVLTTLVLLTLFVSFLKRRIVPGITGVVIWPVAIYTACRLGKPSSWWAKRFYDLRSPENRRGRSSGSGRTVAPSASSTSCATSSAGSRRTCTTRGSRNAPRGSTRDSRSDYLHERRPARIVEARARRARDRR